MNTLDIILIAVIGVSAIVGMVRGLIKTVFGLTSMLIAVLLTVFFTPQVAGYINDYTEFDEMISEKAVELLNLDKSISIDLKDMEALETIQDLNLPGNVVDSIEEHMTKEIIEVMDVSNVVEYIGGSIASMAVNALVFLVLFIIISMLLNAVATLLDLVSQLPVLDQMNRLGGFGIGLILGVLTVWIGLLGISFAISIQATTELSDLIESSILTKLFYYNNPLQNFVMDLAKALGL